MVLELETMEAELEWAAVARAAPSGNSVNVPGALAWLQLVEARGT